MKLLFKLVFAIYLFTLLWLVLFKFSYDMPAVLGIHIQSLNFNPLTAFSQGNMREAAENLIVFVPFGLLLGICFKQWSFRRMLTIIFAVSLAVEVAQFVLAIGRTDITDLIMNTGGGLVGLLLYKLGTKHADSKKLDLVTSAVILLLILAVLYLRIFVLRVRY
jgi:glycopeptide antibiotics resistance protein